MNTNTITIESLEQFGIDTSRSDIDSFLTHLNELLEVRLGAEITELLDDTKLDELLIIQESGDEKALGDWIQTNVPDIEQVVQDEIDNLLGEVAENSDEFNQSA